MIKYIFVLLLVSCFVPTRSEKDWPKKGLVLVETWNKGDTIFERWKDTTNYRYKPNGRSDTIWHLR